MRDVHVGDNCRKGFGARLIAEGAPIVHIKTVLKPNAVVPIGWVAVGGISSEPGRPRTIPLPN